MILSGLFSTTVFAQKDERVVVTATRLPTISSRFAGAWTLVTRKEIERYQYRYLSDALSSVPGLYIAPSGGGGAQTSVFVRGAESNHVTVIVDGVEVTDPAFGNTAFLERLQLNDVEQIEILRGPYSAQHGSSAIGGVIHIVTYRGQGEVGARVDVEYGSLNSKRIVFNTSGENDRFDFSLGVGYFDTDGESFTPRRLRNGVGEDDAYENIDVKMNFGVQLNEFLQFDLRYGRIDSENDYDENSTPFETNALEQFRDEDRVQAKLSAQTSRWNGYWQISHYRGKTRQSDGSSFYGEREKFEWYNHFMLTGDWRLSLGAETELEKIHNSDSLSTISETGRNQSIYAETRWTPVSGLSIAAGLRYDDPNYFDSENSAQISVAYQIPDTGLALRANYGTAFKVPTLSEQFGFGGNPMLDPEESDSWEIGVHLTGSSVGKRLNNVRWGATYFDNEIKDLIAYNSIAQRLENINSASIEGLELSFAIDIDTASHLAMDYTLTSGKDQDGRRLPRRPLRQMNLRWHWQPIAEVSLALRGRYVGERTDVQRDTFARDNESGYAVLDLTAAYQLSDDLRLSLQVNNLSDKEYEPVDGFQGTGTEVYIGLHSTMR